MNRTQIDPKRVAGAFDRHANQPNLSTDSYVRARRLELGEKVMKRERIYLDLCFWLRLRDVEIGRESDLAVASLLAALRESRRAGRTICPIGESTFLEVMKQTDTCTLTATARLIDELSEGIALAPLLERMNTEVVHFVHQMVGNEVYPLEHLMWTKLSNILGVFHPHVTGISEADLRTLQKAFFDEMWDRKLEEIVSMLKTWPSDAKDFAATAQSLNRANSIHASEMKSFVQVYRDEFIGALSLTAPIAQSVFEDMFEEQGGARAAISVMERQQAESGVLGLFVAIIRKKPVEAATSLRTAHIGALCHAAVRWDKTRKMSGNDLYDFHHAQAAVGYCDAFFTEKPLCDLFSQKHVNNLKHLPCRIIASIPEAVIYVEEKCS